MIGASLSRTSSLLAFAILAGTYVPLSRAQQANPPAKESSPAPTEKNAAQIELLETKYRFETNGDSRKEVHARVRINNELGARQFARLNFDFNRSFQSVEIPLVRITHPSGGTADILPSAITDNPNPAVADYPAYHDVRVKSVRILGLAPDDLLEYRVITNTAHHPLAPDFWLDHTFDHTGIVSNESFEITIPASRKVQLYSSPLAPFTSLDEFADQPNATRTYRWERSPRVKPQQSGDTPPSAPEIVITTFDSWQELTRRVAKLFETPRSSAPSVHEKATALVRAADPESLLGYRPGRNIEALYNFVSQEIRTIDLPLGSTGFRTRNPADVLSAGYGTPEDKFILFAALTQEVITLPRAGFVAATMPKAAGGLARPSVFDHLLTEVGVPSVTWWLDLNLEVAPYGSIPSQFRGKRALIIGLTGEDYWREIPSLPPVVSEQNVGVAATLSSNGTLDAKVKYTLRGDNELLLRVAFHQTPIEKWKDVAQMLALSDGFRGQIVNVTTSDPSATKEPFTVEYEISQLKFVDWSKKTVRIPAILPLPGLPDPVIAAQAQAKNPIRLGTPLVINLEATIELPAGATAQAPIGTAVNRDYATFSSKYSAPGNILQASRSYHFLSSELPASRANDLNAFLHAVQSDQTQLFTITPAPK